MLGAGWLLHHFRPHFCNPANTFTETRWGSVMQVHNEQLRLIVNLMQSLLMCSIFLLSGGAALTQQLSNSSFISWYWHSAEVIELHLSRMAITYNHPKLHHSYKTSVTQSYQCDFLNMFNNFIIIQSELLSLFAQYVHGILWLGLFTEINWNSTVLTKSPILCSSA